MGRIALNQPVNWNGTAFAVTENAAAAVQRFRCWLRSRFPWIDDIRIDRSSAADRSAQAGRIRAARTVKEEAARQACGMLSASRRLRVGFLVWIWRAFPTCGASANYQQLIILREVS